MWYYHAGVVNRRVAHAAKSRFYPYRTAVVIAIIAILAGHPAARAISRPRIGAARQLRQ